MGLPSTKDLMDDDFKALDELIFGATTTTTTSGSGREKVPGRVLEKQYYDYKDEEGGSIDLVDEIFGKGFGLEESGETRSEGPERWQEEEMGMLELDDDDDDDNYNDPNNVEPLDFAPMFRGLNDSPTPSSPQAQDTTTSSSSSFAYPSSNPIPSPPRRMTERRLTPSKSVVKEFALAMLYASSESLKNVITGKVAGHVPADIYGETLDQEIAACQLQADNVPVPYTDLEIESLSILEASTNSLPDSITTNRKLYGGAQYHRTLRNFHHRILSVPIPPASQDEISLLVHGISSNVHDGTDLLRTVAKLSSKRMEYLADYLLKEMAQRVEYVLDRMWCVVEYALLVRNNGPFMKQHSRNSMQISPMQYDLLEQDLQSFLRASYRNFVQTQVGIAYKMAREDIFALLRFVSWDLAFSKERSTSEPKTPNIKKENNAMNVNTNVDFDPYDGDIDDDDDSGDLVGGVLSRGNVPYASAPNNDKSKTDDILNIVMQSVKAAAPSADNTFAPTCAAINTLVQHVTNRWRMDISNIVMTKFNAFCLLPFHDEFTSFLRDEIAEYLSERSF